MRWKRNTRRCQRDIRCLRLRSYCALFGLGLSVTEDSRSPNLEANAW